MKSILLGRRHGKDKWELIAGPEIPHSDQVAMRQEMTQTVTNETYAEVEFYRADVDSRIKHRLTFHTKKEGEAAQKAADAREVELDAMKANDAARQKTILEGNAQAEAEEHRKRVLELNKLHDAHRNLISPTKRKAA